MFRVSNNSSAGRWATDKMVMAMETVGVAPKGSRRVSQLLNTAADALVLGGIHNIFTPMFFCVVRKPLN
jgi:sterol 24-C-methyltransferase